MALLRGLDVSRHQQFIDWPRVSGDREFILVGLTHWPTGEIDWEAANNVAGADARRLVIGGYHRVNPLLHTAEWEAALLLGRLHQLGLLGRGRLLPAVDIEPVESGKDREGEAGITMATWVRRFFTAWATLSGNARILWYTSGSFYADRYGGLADIPPQVSLWVAHWSGPHSTPKNPNADPAMAEAWAGQTPYRGDAAHPALIHQYWSKGRVAGISTNVDLNCLTPGTRLADVMQ